MPTGTELNRIHRPGLPGVLFGIAVVLTLSGIFMQYILYDSEPLNTTIYNTSYATCCFLSGDWLRHYSVWDVRYMFLFFFVKIQLVFIRSGFWNLSLLACSFRARSLSGRPVPLAIICVCCIHCPMHCCYTPTGKKDGKPLSGCMCCHSCFSERS